MFHPVRVSTAEQLQTLLHQIIKRIMKLLTRLGYLVEEQDMLFLAETYTDVAMAPLQSAACITFNFDAGRSLNRNPALSDDVTAAGSDFCRTV